MYPNKFKYVLNDNNDKLIKLYEIMKDEHKTKMHKMIKKVANKNISLITKFQELNPEWRKIASKVSDQFNKIVIEAMGGKGENDYEKEEKIIKKVAKEVCIDKGTNE